MEKKVLVIGGGVIGLSSAICLLEDGWDVRIHSAEFSPNTTSDVAAALWYPFLSAPVEKTDAWGSRTYDILKLLTADEKAGIEMPDANQIEIHPWHVVSKSLAEYMDKNEILPIAYSTLAPIPNWREGSRWNGKPEDMKSGAMPCENIANKYGVTVPQLFLKWAIQLGYPVLPKSVKYDRLKENLSLDHFEISIDDMTSISNIAIDEQKCLAWSGDFDPLEVD